MPWAAAWRRSLAVWLLPAFAYVCLARLQGDPVSTAGYGVALTAAGSGAVFLVAPLCAVSAAFEGSRLRSGRLRTFPSVRPGWQVVGAALVPTLTVGATFLLLSVMLSVVPHLPDPAILSGVLAVVVAWAVAGFALGATLPAAVSLPTSLLVCYLWMALPGALEPLWLRHLTGFWFDCCMTDQVLSWRALTGTLLVAAGVAAAAWTMMGWGSSRSLLRGPVPWGAAIAAVPVALACWVVSPLGVAPAAAWESAVTCDGAQPRVCVWPEHRGLLAEAVQVGATAPSRWRSAGLSTPDRFSERAADAGTAGGGTTATVGFGDRPSTGDLLSSYVAAMLPPPTPACAEQGPFVGGDAYGFLTAWLALDAGVTIDDLPDRVGQDAVDVARQAIAAPPAQRERWVAANLAALRACDVPAARGV